MDLGLRGARALVLGSSSGLGRAVAHGLAVEGADVVVTGRDRARVQAVARDVGGTPLVADLTDGDAASRLVGQACDALGGLDVCVVNTGGGAPGGLLSTGPADRRAAYRSMLEPALDVALATADPLRAGGDGRLVFLAARSVLEASPELALSAVMRSGVTAAARSLARELAPHVRVNVVATGQFDTPALQRFEAARAAAEGRPLAEVRADHVASIPLGRLGRADELADVVTFLCSRRSTFVTGTVVRVDGGAVRGY